MERCLETTVENLELEPANFRIDSKGWSEKVNVQGVHYLEHPERDVWELLDGEFAGEQFFTQDAALRHALEAGKRIPTIDEWALLVHGSRPANVRKTEWPDGAYVRERFGLGLCGYRNLTSGAYSLMGTNGNYWTSSTIGVFGHFTTFSAHRAYLAYYALHMNGFSVRCLADPDHAKQKSKGEEHGIMRKERIFGTRAGKFSDRLGRMDRETRF